MGQVSAELLASLFLKMSDVELPATEFGLLVYSQSGGRAAAVRSVSSDLQRFVDHGLDAFGGVCSVPPADLVNVFRGWNWLPSHSECPVGCLRYEGSNPLPPNATTCPAAATSAAVPPAVQVDDLPVWQRVLWESSPLNKNLFDRLSVHDVDRGFFFLEFTRPKGTEILWLFDASGA
jgi:hypothetical protein